MNTLKQKIPRIAPALILSLFIVALSVHGVHAQTNTVSGSAGDSGDGIGSIFGVSSLFNFLLEGISTIVGTVLLTVASWFVSLTGTLLNVSMYFTTHIGIFVNDTPVIYSVWGIIRNLASLMLIFFILWAALQMILDIKQASFGNLIKNIVIVGVLINFSFFFTQVLIDASNVVSLEFYNAIAPTNTASIQCTSTTSDPCSNLSAVTTQLLTSGGLSDIFMSALKVTSWYNDSGQLTASLSNGQAAGSGSSATAQASSISKPLQIIITAGAGSVVMITAGLSFLVVALACIARLAILIFLLAFSAIWIASIALPSLKKFSDMWTNQFRAQLVFLPVYLALMYVAIRVLTESNLNDFTSTAPQGLGTFVNLFVGFSIVIFLLNVPLVAAVQVAGASVGWTDKMFKEAKGWTRKQISGGSSSAWKNTGGRFASAVSRSEGFKDLASRQGLLGGAGRLALKGTRTVATDYNKKLDSQVKSRTDFAESLGYDERSVNTMEMRIRQMNQQKAAFKAAGNAAGANEIQGRIDTMEQRIVNKKKERQGNYAAELSSKGLISAAPNLWMKVARKDKVAAAKINVGVWQKQLDAKKEDLKGAKNNLNQIENDIKSDVRQNGVANAANTAEKVRLQGEIATLTSNPDHGGNVGLMGIAELENVIGRAKLVK